jgi:hypothetical protein
LSWALVILSWTSAEFTTSRRTYLITTSGASLRSLVTALRPRCHPPDWCISKLPLPTLNRIIYHAFLRHFGKEVIVNRTKLSPENPKVDILWLKLYKVRAIYVLSRNARQPWNIRNSSKRSMVLTTESCNIQAISNQNIATIPIYLSASQRLILGGTSLWIPRR